MRALIDNVVVRLLLYYATLVVVFLMLLEYFPWIDEAVAKERARAVATALVAPALDTPTTGATSVLLTDVDVIAPIALTLLGALALSLPVALVYQWTRDAEPYRRDFARALIALPIAVALAVFLVKNSLALAFSLAGIVAAIRWRAGLNETMDGVFMFVVIGIGLAAGTQLLTVALVASVIFNASILTLARVSYGARPRRLEGFTLTAAAEMPVVDAHRKFSIRAAVSNQARAEAHIETLLATHSKKWTKLGDTRSPDGRVLVEYEVTLKKRSTPAELQRALADSRVPEIGEVTVVRRDRADNSHLE
jgi:hypothetical protein